MNKTILHFKKLKPNTQLTFLETSLSQVWPIQLSIRKSFRLSLRTKVNFSLKIYHKSNLLINKGKTEIWDVFTIFELKEISPVKHIKIAYGIYSIRKGHGKIKYFLPKLHYKNPQLCVMSCP